MWLPSGSGLSQETCEWNIKSYKAWDELYLEDESKAMEAGVHVSSFHHLTTKSM